MAGNADRGIVGLVLPVRGAAFVPYRLRRRELWRLPVSAWQTGVAGTLLIGGGIGTLNTVLP